MDGYRVMSFVVFLQLNSWMTQIAVAVIGQHNDMGANLSSGRDFLELHERLNEDMKVASKKLKALKQILPCTTL